MSRPGTVGCATATLAAKLAMLLPASSVVDAATCAPPAKALAAAARASSDWHASQLPSNIIVGTKLPNEGAATRPAGGLARQWARRAVLEIARDLGGQIAARPVFRDEPALGLGAADAEPLSGLAAAAQLKFALRRLTVEYARLAREKGHSWREIGVALGLKQMADMGMDAADVTYEHLAGAPSPWRPAFVWVCPTCRSTVLDHGPQAGHPADCEDGHADGCLRLAAAVTDWHAAWDEDGNGGRP